MPKSGKIKKRTLIPGICLYCKKEFFGYRKDKIFCNNKCKFKEWEKDHPRINLNKVLPEAS